MNEKEKEEAVTPGSGAGVSGETEDKVNAPAGSGASAAPENEASSENENAGSEEADAENTSEGSGAETEASDAALRNAVPEDGTAADEEAVKPEEADRDKASEDLKAEDDAGAEEADRDKASEDLKAEDDAGAEGADRDKASEDAMAEAPAEDAQPADGTGAEASPDAKAETAAEPEKKKKSRRGGFIALGILVVAAAAFVIFYCVRARGYSDTFIPGTVINDIDASDKTADEVENEIRRNVENYSLQLSFREGDTKTLSAKELGYTYASDGGVQKLLDGQNSFAWLLGKLGRTESYTVSTDADVNEDTVRTTVSELPEMNAASQVQPEDAYMKFGDDHRLAIVPEVEGNALDEEAVVQAVIGAVRARAGELNLEDAGAYKSPSVTADDADLNTQVKDLNSYLDVTVVYNMYDGSTATLDKDTTWQWLSQNDESGRSFYFNTEVVRDDCAEWIRTLASSYDNSSDTVEFQSTNRGTVELPSSAYGHVIDQQSEAANLYSIILGRTSRTLEPAYSLDREPDPTFGGNYIEVDLQNQEVYLYEGGNQVFSCDCVSGKGSDPSRRTPTGVYSIYDKERNRTLKGQIDPATGQPSYTSFVNFWMPFYRGYGLHDAPWRGSFGGDIYYYSGSHGCVNLSYSSAEYLYDNCSVGTTVVVI